MCLVYVRMWHGRVVCVCRMAGYYVCMTWQGSTRACVMAGWYMCVAWQANVYMSHGKVVRVCGMAE